MKKGNLNLLKTLKEMELNYDEKRLKAFSNKFKAAQLLLNNNYYNQSLVLYDSALREIVFLYNENNELIFNSTKEALLNFMKGNFDNEFKETLLLVNHIAIMADWDYEFSLTKNEIGYIDNKLVNFFSKTKLILYGFE